MIQEHNTFAKAVERNALVVPVHWRIIAFGEREGFQAIGLNFVEAEAGRIGRPGGKKRNSDGPGKILWCNPLDGFVQLVGDVGRWRVFARVASKFESDLAGVDDLRELTDHSVPGMSRQNR